MLQMMKNKDFLLFKNRTAMPRCNYLDQSRIKRNFLPLRRLFSYGSKLLKCFSDYMKYYYGFSNKKLQIQPIIIFLK